MALDREIGEGGAGGVVKQGDERGGVSEVMGPSFTAPCRFDSSRSCGEPIGLDEEIGGDFPTCIDLLNHLQGQGAAPS
jgi:hypothetical protein